MTEILAIICQVPCDECEGTGWVPDESGRRRGNEGALQPCFLCNGAKVMKRAMSLTEVCAALQRQETP
jgi:DnaJ-class molecular chaperone